MFEDVKEYIDEKLIKGKNIPYLDLCVYKDHKEIHRYITGSAGKTFTGKEKLYMYSCTKPLTAVCGMRLIEEGKLSLDDKVSKYIPEFENAFVLTSDGEKKKVGDKMKVYHLFTMSAGLDYDRNKLPIREFCEKNKEAGTVEAVKTFIESPLNFEPGEKFLYSLCHDVLGAVIEVASGKRFSDYMDEIIFSPLGMKDSTLRPQKYAPELFETYNAAGMKKVDNSAYKGFIITDNYESGGAGLISTVPDYAVFADTLASMGMSASGYRMLKPETVEEMRSLKLSQLSVKNAYTCVQGRDYGYGLGVRTRTVPHPCGIPAGEFGWDGAAGSYLMVDTEHKISVTMGMNILSWPVAFTGEHLNIVERIYKEIL